MLDRLFDFIGEIIDFFICFTVMDVYERGIVMRFGMPNREIGGGFHWLIPFGVEEVKYDTVVRQTSDLDVQSLTSKDGKFITLNAILVYTISDISKFLLEIDDGETDVQNMCYGVITDCVEAHNWDEICTTEFNKEVLKKCRAVCDNYCGVKLIHVKWSDKAVARNIRLWND
jgi:regulator of protease activity HflC (stomatin/prohibitin superfamily)